MMMAEWREEDFRGDDGRNDEGTTLLRRRVWLSGDFGGDGKMRRGGDGDRGAIQRLICGVDLDGRSGEANGGGFQSRDGQNSGKGAVMSGSGCSGSDCCSSGDRSSESDRFRHNGAGTCRRRKVKVGLRQRRNDGETGFGPWWLCAFLLRKIPFLFFFSLFLLSVIVLSPFSASILRPFYFLFSINGKDLAITMMMDGQD